MDKQNRILRLLGILIILNPIVDLIMSLSRRFTSMSISFATIYRSLIMLWCIFLIIKHIYKSVCIKEVSTLVKIVIVSSGLIIIHFVIFILTRDFGYDFKLMFLEAMYYQRYLFFPIIFTAALIHINSGYLTASTRLIRYVEVSGLVYALLIIVPFITNTSFDSYSISELEGSVGWFYGSNEIGLILGIVLNLYYFKIAKGNLSFKSIFEIFIVIISMVIVGTKASLLLIISFLLFISFHYLSVWKYKHKKFVFLVGLFLSVLLVTKLPAFNNIIFILEYNGFERFFAGLLSGRLTFLRIALERFNSVSIGNRFLGIGALVMNSNGIWVADKLIEMDLFDLLIRYGIILTSVVFYPIIYCSFLSLKNIIQNVGDNIRCIVSLTLLLLMTLISILVGHVVSAPAVSTYLCVLLVLIVSDTRRNIEIGNLRQST